jgi:hypothetical protein
MPFPGAVDDDVTNRVVSQRNNTVKQQAAEPGKGERAVSNCAVVVVERAERATVGMLSLLRNRPSVSAPQAPDERELFASADKLWSPLSLKG